MISNRNLSFLILIICLTVFTSISVKEKFQNINEISRKYKEPLNSRCIAMFDLGYLYRSNYYSPTRLSNLPLSNEINWLTNAKKTATQQTADYLPFVRSIASMVGKVDGKGIFKNGTRLKIMSGKLPYIPCSIRDYSPDDLKKCYDIRTERNEPPWIAFMGDSKMRNMVHYFMNKSHQSMNWTIDDNFTFSDDSFISYSRAINYERTIHAKSFSGALLTLIGAPYGFFSKKNSPANSQDILKTWLNQSHNERLPDVLIIEFGGWHFLMTEIHYLERSAQLLKAWKELMKIVGPLSRRMTIICHMQTRLRYSAMKYHNDQLRFGKVFQKWIFSDYSIHTSSSLMDQVMVNYIKDTNVIIWDTTIPFNMASSSECDVLLKDNHSAIIVEKERKILRHFRPFMCNDISHKTEATLHDETTMILNLLCNKYFPIQDNYCC